MGKQRVRLSEEQRAKIIEQAHVNFRKYQHGVHGQIITEWDSVESWVADAAIAALEPVTVQEPRQVSDVPPDGTWAVLHPGHYGAFTACALSGKWSMCDDADLRFATHWVPCPFTARALAERGK